MSSAPASLSPAEQGEVLTLPRLAIERAGQLEIVFPETLVDVGGWDLRQVATGLPGFVLSDRPDTFEIDVDGDQVVYSRIDAAGELALDDATDWNVATLSRWLDRTTRQRDVAQPIFLEYCRRVVDGVAERVSLAQLVRGKYALRRAIIGRVSQLRREAGERGVQLLLGDIAPVLALGENGFHFSKAGYDPRTPYSGPWRPRKHLFSQVGDLRHGGEEWMAAMAIDDHPAVRHWVRNARPHRVVLRAADLDRPVLPRLRRRANRWSKAYRGIQRCGPHRQRGQPREAQHRHASAGGKRRRRRIPVGRAGSRRWGGAAN